MIEKKALTFEDILSTAKTFTVTPKRCREFENKKWVSKDLVLQLREQQREKETSLRKKSEELQKALSDFDNEVLVSLQAHKDGMYQPNPNWVLLKIRDLAKLFSDFEREFEGLREVLGSGKEGDEK